MRFVSTDRSIEIQIKPPLGFGICIDGHWFFFGREAQIIGNVPPQPGKGLHTRTSSPRFCKGCFPFIEEDYVGRKDKVKQ